MPKKSEPTFEWNNQQRPQPLSALLVIVGQKVVNVADDVSTYYALNAQSDSLESSTLNLTRRIQFGAYELQISNPMSLMRHGHGGEPLLRDLVGQLVLSVEEDAAHAAIRLTGDITVRVDLREESYVGPEAMVLSGPQALFVVWN